MDITKCLLLWHLGSFVYVYLCACVCVPVNVWLKKKIFPSGTICQNNLNNSLYKKTAYLRPNFKKSIFDPRLDHTVYRYFKVFFF